MVQNAPHQGKPTLSISDANRLDGTLFDLADGLEALAILCRDLAERYPHVRDLKAIERNVKSAHAALEKTKNPARVIWNLSTEAAATEGRRHD